MSNLEQPLWLKMTADADHFSRPAPEEPQASPGLQCTGPGVAPNPRQCCQLPKLPRLDGTKTYKHWTHPGTSKDHQWIWYQWINGPWMEKMLRNRAIDCYGQGCLREKAEAEVYWKNLGSISFTSWIGFPPQSSIWTHLQRAAWSWTSSEALSLRIFKRMGTASRSTMACVWWALPDTMFRIAHLRCSIPDITEPCWSCINPTIRQNHNRTRSIQVCLMIKTKTVGLSENKVPRYLSECPIPHPLANHNFS